MHGILRLAPVALLSIFAGPAASPAAASDWPTYNGAGSRAGVVTGAPAFQGFRRRFSRQLDGEVYAQPLIVRGTIYAATENNTVYGFSAGGKRLFARHLGAPVPGSDLPCGNINPSGITGTPAVAGSRLYVVAYLRDGHQHVLFVLDSRSGRVLLRRRIDPANALIQQQRGALLVDHSRVYVPYGGLYGDCGPYHGVIVSVTTAGGGRRSYVNPSAEAGIWAPAGISETDSGELLIATGNGGRPGGFAYANSVIRLSASLSRLAFWAPADWAGLSRSDTDIGSVAPLPLAGGRVFQSGKNGTGYLLSPGLGGIARELHHADLCNATFGALASRPPFVLVPCSDALIAVRVQGNSFSTAWQIDGGATSPLIAGDTVIYGEKRSGRLHAVRLSDGHEIAATDLGSPATSFPSGAGAGDTLVEPGSRSISVLGGL